MTAVESSLTWSLAYGHYQPDFVLPPADEVAVRDVRSCVERPLRGQEDALRLMRSMAALSPMMARALDLMEQRRLTLQVAEVARPLSTFRPDVRSLILLPKGKAPLDHLASLLTVIGSALEPPSGMEHPRPEQCDPRRDRDRFWLVYGWNLAMAKSFLFQCAAEMEARRVRFSMPNLIGGILRPTDMALYRIFRETGLAGLAGVFRTFMPEKDRQLVEASIATLVDGGVGAYPDPDWMPSLPAERPSLPRSFLDDHADVIGSWGKGFLTTGLNGAETVSEIPLPSFIDWNKPVQDENDLQEAVRLVASLSPTLAKIVAPLKEGRVHVQMVDQTLGDPLTLLMPLGVVFGLPTEQKPTLELQRGFLMKNILVNLVGELARLAVPETVYQRIQLVETSNPVDQTYQLAHLLDYRYRCRGAWSLTAQLELRRQASRWSHELYLNPTLQKMARVLEEEGLDVLVEMYGGLLGDSNYQREQRRHVHYANQLVHHGGFIVLKKILEGQTVEPSEIETLLLAVKRGAVAASAEGFRLLGRIVLHSEDLVERADDLERVRALQALRQRWRTIQLAFEALPKRLRDTRPDIARALEQLDAQIREGHDVVELREILAVQEQALSPLRVQWEAERAQGRELRRLAGEARKKVQAAAREAQRLEEEARTQAAREEAARVAADKAREAAEQARVDAALRREQEISAAIRREEAARRSTGSVLAHRRSELMALIGRLEEVLSPILFGLIEKEELPLEVIDQPQVELMVESERRTIRMKSSLTAEADTIMAEYGRAVSQPLDQAGVTNGMVERMRALCDLVRSYLIWLSKPQPAHPRFPGIKATTSPFFRR